MRAVLLNHVQRILPEVREKSARQLCTEVIDIVLVIDIDIVLCDIVFFSEDI